MTVLRPRTGKQRPGRESPRDYSTGPESRAIRSARRGRCLRCEAVGERTPTAPAAAAPLPASAARRRARLDLAVAEHEHVRAPSAPGRAGSCSASGSTSRRPRPAARAHAGRRPARSAASMWRSAIGITTAWTGAAPERERAREVLDEHADEPLERAVDRAVDRDRPLLLAVLVDVVQVEALGQHQPVDLDRRRLPLAAERVLDLDVDLGRVERAVLRLDAVLDARTPSSASSIIASVSRHVAVVAERLVGLRPERQRRLEAEPE